MAKKQTTLFDYQKASQKIPNMSDKLRNVIHRELPKFFECINTNLDSHRELDDEITLAINRNELLSKRLLEEYSPHTLGVGIIHFLAQLEDNKKIFVRKAGEMKTFTYKHFFEKERGYPYLYFKGVINVVGEKAKFSKYSKIISNLLLKNVGEDDGSKEKFFLSTLEKIGTKKDVLELRKYRTEVKNGNFGHPKYKTQGDTAYLVEGDLKKKIQMKLIENIDSVIRKVSKK